MRTPKPVWFPLALGAALAASFAWTQRSQRLRAGLARAITLRMTSKTTLIAVLALMSCGMPYDEEDEPAIASTSEALSCQHDSSCPSGFECIDGACQGASHPAWHPFTGKLPLKTHCPLGSKHCNACVDDVRQRFDQIRDGFNTDGDL